jgi:hypothetical protein
MSEIDVVEGQKEPNKGRHEDPEFPEVHFEQEKN